MKIIADTATLLSPAEGEALGLTVIPVSVAVNEHTYQDYIEITSSEFLEIVEAGGVATTSQPAIGDILDELESTEEEVLILTVGDGLSGGYQTAMSARNCVEDPERVHVINSKTLAGPLRYLAKKAVALKEQGWNVERIKQELSRCIDSSVSFVIPENFEFLKRSGRLTPIAAKIGGALKLLPVLTLTRDSTRITPIGVKRSWKTAVDTVIHQLQKLPINEDYLISVSHAGTYQKAVRVLEQIREQIRTPETEILELSPALITHGGPGCIVIQAIRK